MAGVMVRGSAEGDLGRAKNLHVVGRDGGERRPATFDEIISQRGSAEGKSGREKNLHVGGNDGGT